jgi:hypothetical protein
MFIDLLTQAQPDLSRALHRTDTLLIKPEFDDTKWLSMQTHQAERASITAPLLVDAQYGRKWLSQLNFQNACRRRF